MAKIKISGSLVESVRKMAYEFSDNIGSDAPEFYVEYYLNLSPHIIAVNSIGKFLGIGPGHKVLEIGSGLGTRCLAGRAVLGADFTGCEPCANTYSNLHDAIVEFRKCNPDLPYALVEKGGEDTSLPPEFDFVLSSEVLEHVRDPKRVISEAFRVLKPGGRFFFSTCNYRSFYEGHYRCLWLPFLNKKSARYWIKLLGYNTTFLEEINFLNRRDILEYLRSAGFYKMTLGVKYPVISAEGIEVELPAGFDPVFRGRRRCLWGTVIQHPFAQKTLGSIGMEYKIWGVAEKPR